jgi:hypothetical protein
MGKSHGTDFPIKTNPLKPIETVTICNLSMVGFPASPLYPHWSIDEGSTMLNNAKKTQVRLDSRTKLLNPKFYEARRHGDEGFYEVPSMLWMVNNSKNNYNM